MNQQPPPDPDQRLNIDNASIQSSQIGQAGRDLIQGQVVNVTVYDNIDVAGLLGRQTASSIKPLTQQEYRNRKVLLNKVKKFWIEAVLEKSLHIRTLIELGLEERLDATDHPFSSVQELPEETRKPLPIGTGITQVFNQMGEGRTLLILGEPGAGKTITLLKLAQNLIARTEEDLGQLIPVVFNLSSWEGKQQSIADWLVQELSSKYQVSPALGKAWVEGQQLVLLLDGLDEVKVERQKACVHALNEFMQTYGQIEIIICSRVRDYEALSTRLKLQGAICIQSLMPGQINQYLQAGDLEGVKTLLQGDTALQELAKSPLMLSVMILAYQGIPVADLPQAGSVEEHRQHLLDTYIERMLRRRKTDQQYSKAKAIRWLNWLAQQMARESQTVFLIERIQPTWLQTKEGILYRLGSVLIGGLIYGLIGLLIGGLTGGLIGLLLGTVLISAWGRTEVETVETLRWSWEEARRGLIGGLVLGLALGLILGLVLGWLNLVKNGLILGLIYGVIGGLILQLLVGLRGPEIETKAIPNQGIWRSARNAGIIGLVGGLIGGLLGGLVGGLMGLMSWLIFGLIYGLISGLIFGGGKACITHFTLRLVLCQNNYIPWNYTRFLDYATERIFLQKVGGGYIFIHRLLLEHFAQLKIKN